MLARIGFGIPPARPTTTPEQRPTIPSGSPPPSYSLLYETDSSIAPQSSSIPNYPTPPSSPSTEPISGFSPQNLFTNLNLDQTLFSIPGLSDDLQAQMKGMQAGFIHFQQQQTTSFDAAQAAQIEAEEASVQKTIQDNIKTGHPVFSPYGLFEYNTQQPGMTLDKAAKQTKKPLYAIKKENARLVALPPNEKHGPNGENSKIMRIADIQKMEKQGYIFRELKDDMKGVLKCIPPIAIEISSALLKIAGWKGL